MHRAAAAVGLAFALVACKRSGGAPSQPAAGAAPAPAAPAATAAFVTAASSVRREPSDLTKVKGADGKDKANFVTLLHRGEQVTVLEAKEDWVHIRSSDDKEGWLRGAGVLQGEGLQLATLQAPADLFDRPDLLAANAKRKLDAGTLLIVVKTRPPFSEVNVSGSASAWVLTERLATGDREVQMAKLIEKARWLERSKKHEEALRVLALARDAFAGAPLVDVLAADLGEAAAPVPTSATTPAPAPATEQPAAPR